VVVAATVWLCVCVVWVRRWMCRWRRMVYSRRGRYGGEVSKVISEARPDPPTTDDRAVFVSSRDLASLTKCAPVLPCPLSRTYHITWAPHSLRRESPPFPRGPQRRISLSTPLDGRGRTILPHSEPRAQNKEEKEDKAMRTNANKPPFLRRPPPIIRTRCACVSTHVKARSWVCQVLLFVPSIHEKHAPIGSKARNVCL
jgi:hypothetical protein